MTSEVTAESTSPADSYIERVTTAIGAIARDIDDGRISPGDQAALRRGWETGPGPALWRLAVHRLEPQGLARTLIEERRWSIIAAGLVETRGLAHRVMGFGQAAAQAGVAEMRLLRILRGHDEVLYRVLRGVVVQSANAGYGFHWRDPALLVLFDGVAAQARTCRNIARDYYRTLAAQGHGLTS